MNLAGIFEMLMILHICDMYICTMYNVFVCIYIYYNIYNIYIYKYDIYIYIYCTY